MGVLTADHWAAILEDDKRREMAVIAESIEEAEAAGHQHDRCEHDEIAEFRILGGVYDDTTVIWAQCKDCHDWLVVTMYRNGRDDDVRKMSDREKDALQKFEDRQRDH
jgi:hypothetical protein